MKMAAQLTEVYMVCYCKARRHQDLRGLALYRIVRAVLVVNSAHASSLFQDLIMQDSQLMVRSELVGCWAHENMADGVCCLTKARRFRDSEAARLLRSSEAGHPSFISCSNAACF